MRQVQDDARARRANRLHDRLIRFGREFRFAFEDGWRDKEREMVAALEKEAIQKHIVQPLRRRESLGDALARLLIEVQARRAESEVVVDDRRVDLKLLRDVPTDIVGNGRGSDPAACANECDYTADRGGIRTEVEAGDDFDQRQRVYRRN